MWVSVPTDQPDALRQQDAIVSNEMQVPEAILDCASSKTDGPSLGEDLTCAPVSRIIDSVTLANVSSSQSPTADVAEMRLEESVDASNKNNKFNLPPSPMTVVTAASMPSDERSFVRNAGSNAVEASFVAKASMMLADHLMGVLEGKEGSDDAALEEMEIGRAHV